MIITIDGPVASGKSTMAKRLAEELGIYYLYTGLFYRAIAYVFLKQVGQEEFCEFIKSIKSDDLKFIKNFSYDYGSDGQRSRPYLFFKGEDISSQLYATSLDQFTSILSTNRLVRDALQDLFREIAEKHDLIADGRDCGSIVFPNADFKFYLTADVKTRAERLMVDEKRGDNGKTLEEVEAEVELRDRRDRERAIAPLVIPENAIVIDNSSMTEEETVGKFLELLP